MLTKPQKKALALFKEVEQINGHTINSLQQKRLIHFVNDSWTGKTNARGLVLTDKGRKTNE